MIRLKVAVEIEGTGIGPRVGKSAADAALVRGDQLVFMQREPAPRTKAGCIQNVPEGATGSFFLPFPNANSKGVEIITSCEQNRRESDKQPNEAIHPVAPHRSNNMAKGSFNSSRQA